MTDVEAPEPGDQHEPAGLQPDSSRVDVDFTGDPDEVLLKESQIWVRQDEVYADINKAYTAIMRVFAEDADPTKKLKNHFVNDRDAIPAASQKVFFVQHHNVWYPRLGLAKRRAKEMLGEYEDMLKHHHGADRDVCGSLIKRSRDRYKRACKGHTKAALLVQDLQEHTRTRS